MGIYGKVATAKPTKGGNWFKKGRYRVKVTAVKSIESQEDSTPFYVIETNVLESNNPDIHVGDERSQVIDMTTANGPGNVKVFIAAASGVDPVMDDATAKVEKVWSEVLGQESSLEEICELSFSKDNPLGGDELELECVEVPTRAKENKPAGLFTKHNWIPSETPLKSLRDLMKG